MTSGQAVIGTGGRLAGFVEGSNVVGLVNSASYSEFAENAGTASSLVGFDSASLA